MQVTIQQLVIMLYQLILQAIIAPLMAISLCITILRDIKTPLMVCILYAPIHLGETMWPLVSSLCIQILLEVKMLLSVCYPCLITQWVIATQPLDSALGVI